MGQQKLLALTSTRSVRGAGLLLLLATSFYFLTPFTGIRESTPLSPSHVGNSTSWLAWALPEHLIGTKSESGDPGNKTQEKEPRVRQATMIYEEGKFASIFERSVDSHLRHGEQWGVPTHILRHDIVEAGYFNKPAFILGLIINELAKPLNQRSDWVVWFDADTIILNPMVPWSLFLPPSDFDDLHVIGTRDHNGFNAGVLMIRVHEWSVKMLSEVIALRQFEPEVDLHYEDQSAIQWVLKRPGNAEHFIYQPHDWWNSFGIQGKPGPTPAFLLHFAGVDCCGVGEPKGTVMGRWLEVLEKTPEIYTMPLEKTTLHHEVSDYWSTLTKARKMLEAVDLRSTEKKYNNNGIKTAGTELRWAMMSDADDSAKINAGIMRIENMISKADVG